MAASEQGAAGSAPKVAVLGAAGYAGALAARLIQSHPEFELGPITARADAGKRLCDIYPQHRVEQVLEPFELGENNECEAAIHNCEAAIVAYPHGAAAPVVASLRDHGVKVVDLSADFRLRDVATYEEWYVPHLHPELIEQAVYGLPELYRDQIAGAELVANPGCYPTASILALAPLAGAGLIDELVIDAKSGVSGAGRSLSEASMFVTVDENMNAYKVPRHRHTPEIEQELAARGNPVTITFTPHLIPLDQGELVSCYVSLKDSSRTTAEIEALYHDAYDGERFVELARSPAGVRAVRETNICRISVHRDDRTGRVIVFGAIDNLWKGTASQALQNLNLMFGYPESEGIG